MKIVFKSFIAILLITGINSFAQNLMSSNSTSEGGAIELINPLKTANNTANKWIFYNMTGTYGNSLQFWSYGNNGFYGSRFTILDNGNVGIGINTPNEKLVLNGDGARLKIQTGSNPSTYYTYLESNYDSGNTFNIVDGGIYKFGSKAMGLISGDTYMSSYYGLAFITETTSAARENIRMYINQVGNVGIGTITPNNKLDVNGTIHSKEVKVDITGWPDFVFEKHYTGISSLNPNYKLPTLASIEDYVIANHHLPEVPSATEVAEKGLKLGEMNGILLQKIEELTLYAIDQEKKLIDQENKTDKLTKIIEVQNNKSEQLQRDLILLKESFISLKK